MYFWSHQPQKCSILLQNMDCLGTMWLGSANNLALIALTVFMYLSDELMLTVYWYPYNLQACIVVILCGTAKNTLSFAPKCGCGDPSAGPNRDWLIARAPQVVHAGCLWVWDLVTIWTKSAPVHWCQSCCHMGGGCCLTWCSLAVLHPSTND